jgi:TolA-binding protein
MRNGRVIVSLGKRVVAALLGWLLLAAPVPLQQLVTAQQFGPDAAAISLLDSARRAYNEGKPAYAAERFREFLRLYGHHREAPAAHYGLALALLEMPQKDYAAVASALGQVVGWSDFPQRPQALFFLGFVQKSQAEQAFRQAELKPREAGHLHHTGRGRLEEAARHLAAAVEALATQLAQVPAEDKTAHVAREWLNRARYEYCETLVRLGRFKEAQAAGQPLLEDQKLAKTAMGEAAAFQLACASFAQKNYDAAISLLARLAPFQQQFGLEAQYLLARSYHLSGRLGEAGPHYQAVAARGEERRRVTAVGTAATPSAEAKKPPEAKAPGEPVLPGPAEETLARCNFYLAVLRFEQGKASEALEGLTDFVRAYPQNALAAEAKLWQARCLLELRRFAEANKLLQELHDQRHLADQVLWCQSRAELCNASTADAQAQAQAVRRAIELLGRAAERAGDLARQAPEAKARRAEILLDLASLHATAQAYRDAAATYQRVLGENEGFARAEEVLWRLATMHHLGGEYRAADDACQRFERSYPQSSLLPEVLFIAAENARKMALALFDPANPHRRHEHRQMCEEAVRRYQRVLKHSLPSPRAHQVRLGLAEMHYQLGQYAEVLSVLRAIPLAERSGGLALASYLAADSQLRLLPVEAAEVKQAAETSAQLTEAVSVLENYLAAQRESPRAADALLKLAHCRLRMALLTAEPSARKKLLDETRKGCEQILALREKPSPAVEAVAVYERAKCLALLGETETAIKELSRFQGEPWRNLPVAPAAMILWSGLRREQGAAAEAAQVLDQYRRHYEHVGRDRPEYQQALAALQLEQALGLKESGKYAESRNMLDNIARHWSGKPEGFAAQRRLVDCRRAEFAVLVAKVREEAARPDLKPEQLAAITRKLEESLGPMRQAAEALRVEAARVSQAATAAPGGAVQLEALCVTAACYRTMAEAEIEIARQKMLRQAMEKQLLEKQALEKQAAKQKPDSGAAPPSPARPQVTVQEVPIQPAEKAAYEHYTALLAVTEHSPVAAWARLELAELYANRGEQAPAAKLWRQVAQQFPATRWAEVASQRLKANESKSPSK